jgi:ATP-dependent exoDNAse (exonuclease V) beta subunit
VLDRRTGLVRSLTPGDVAVLVYTNAEAERLSEALALHGIEPEPVIRQVALIVSESQDW